MTHTCAVPGCSRSVFSRQWCQMHYTRWLRGGTTDLRRETDALKRILARVAEVPCGCWVWLGTTNQGGYGMTRYAGKMRQLHRLMYELSVEPIADGLQIDHLCNRPLCCNPAHLEPVTPSENTRRIVERGRHQLASKTHCVNGHAFTAENTRVIYKNGRFYQRQCKECGRVRDRARKARLKAQAA